MDCVSLQKIFNINLKGIGPKKTYKNSENFESDFWRELFDVGENFDEAKWGGDVVRILIKIK